jgi:hypothetical protein
MSWMAMYLSSSYAILAGICLAMILEKIVSAIKYLGNPSPPLAELATAAAEATIDGQNVLPRLFGLNHYVEFPLRNAPPGA